MPSFGDSVRMTVHYHDPLIQGGRYRGEMTTRADGYGHELSTFGGFDSAKVSVALSQADLEEWIERGLGRHIVVYDDANEIVFEGFANVLNATLGSLDYTVGPLLDIANRVRLVYSTFLEGGQGIRATTGWAEDTASVAKYGQFERVLSAGGVSSGEADQIRDTYLAENALPTTSRQQSYSNDGGDAFRLDLEILGYVHWLQTYTYTQTANTGSGNLSDQLAAILAADPNNIVNVDLSGIQANTLQVPVYENDLPVAFDLIKNLVARGDANERRYGFGLFANRQVRYGPVSEQIDYMQHLSDPARQVRTLGGQIVKPWNVKPGRWVFFPDFMVGRVQPRTALRGDPRMLFIENITYQAPWGVSFNGSKASRLDQKLARLGLSGISG